MRLLIGAIVLLAAAGIIVSSYLISPSSLSSAELTQVKSSCTQCHQVPVVRSASSVHAAHENLSCITCHTTGSTARTDFNSCIPCHSIPAYTGATDVHDAHATTNCITCHTNAAGLISASNTHNVLRLAGISLFGLMLVGLVSNYIITRIRLRR